MALRPFWAWLRAGAARQGLSTAAWDAGNLDLSNRGLVNELLTQCRTLHSSPALGMRNKTAQKGGGDEWGWNPLLRPEESTALGADEIRWALERAEELAKEEREAIRQTGSDERVRAANAGNAKGAAVVGGSNVAKHEVVQTARTGAPGAMKSEAHLGEEGKQKGTQFAAKVGGQKSRGATELKRGADVQFKPVKVVKSQPRFDKAKAGAEKPRGDFVRRPEGQLGSGTQPRRLGFGVHKEAPWSGRFQVRQGAALTGDLWNEVAPDAEESFRQSAAELDTAVGVQKSSESVRSTMDDVQKGRRGGGVEEGTEVDSRGVGGVVPKQDLDRGGRLEGHSGEPSTFERVLDVFDGEETVLAGELSGVRLEDDARLTESGGRVTTATGTSHWGVKSKQPIQPVSMPVNLSNSQQESTSSPYNGAATKRRSSADMTEEMGAPFLESVPTSYMATQLESDRLSQRKEGTERLSEESDGSDRFSDGLDGSNRVPDLEELRTWLSQLDRQGEGELEEEENEERRESASVPVEKQKSLRLAIMGPPNAGKSVLTNALVSLRITSVLRILLDIDAINSHDKPVLSIQRT